MVLAAGHHAVIKLSHCGPDIGVGHGPGADGDQRVGFLHPGGKDPARTVIFETAANKMTAIGQKG